ncbi:MAG: HNH endonuclease [Sphingomonadales bacterium]|nr:HNH endonuclease [Sphingomonadales bacterium]
MTGKSGDGLIVFLTNFEEPEGADPSLAWKLQIKVGKAAAARDVAIDLAAILLREEYDLSWEHPHFFPIDDTNKIGQFAFFRSKFFEVEPRVNHVSIKEEAALRIKRAVYAEEAEIMTLKAYVANIEAAIAYQRVGRRRAPIPDDIKMLVWARDGGACTRCGSTDQLHFDHIIPVAKGGGDLAENLQLLCQPCNLRKSDKIAF